MEKKKKIEIKLFSTPFLASKQRKCLKNRYNENAKVEI